MDGQGVEVRERGHLLLATPLLWSHVFRGPDNRPGGRHGLLTHNHDDPKIREEGPVIMIQQDVAGFDIPMHVAKAMGVREGAAYRLNDVEDRRDVERLALHMLCGETFAETFAVNQVHDEVVQGS